ncbi:3-oxoacyl-[acyl-carrier-protein] synthase III C-terminal domain-containing protein [Streptomyces sp. NPDC050560]|uniref:3-oxoacyl-[acyl-carrier-protein] synthase III C-terminal domain-containing protein n=1 Tax=Streptomyces sp. NPDC050560 TaxID=3365630 RepID=UPI0037BD7B29
MRLSEPLGMSGLYAWLPPESDRAADAVAQGRVEPDTAAELGYSALPVAVSAPPEMAVLAARASLDAAAVKPAEVGMALHAWLHHQGHDLWSPAHYIAHELGIAAAAPLGVQQLCNGGAAAVELAAARLLLEPGLGYALITTADRFAEPGFDRWRSDYGIGYGDGATALLLHRLGPDGAELTLYAVNTRAAPELERMHRGDDAFSPAARWHSPHVDMRRTKKAFLAEHGIETFAAAGRERMHAVLRASLRDAGLAADDPRLRCVVLPRLGAKTLDQAYRPAIAEVTDAEIVDLGRDTGHLGAGDTAANLAALSARGILSPGDRALVVNAGAGFTWSCLLVGRD